MVDSAITDAFGTVAAITIGVLVSIFTGATVGAIVLGVLAIGFLFYSTSIADKMQANLFRGIGGTLTFFMLYNFFIALLFFVTPDFVALIFGAITLGTWNIILSLILAALLDGIVVSELTKTLDQAEKLR